MADMNLHEYIVNGGNFFSEGALSNLDISQTFSYALAGSSESFDGSIEHMQVQYLQHRLIFLWG